MKRTMFWLVSGSVLASTLALSLGSVWAQGKAKLRLRGTGNISTLVDVRTQNPLEPSCVFLTTRRGDATFTGLIHTITNGQFETFIVSNQCGGFQGPDSIRDVLRLDDVLIAGRRGGIVITRKGEAAGNPQSPEGVRGVSQLEIHGSTGQLKHMSGNGLAVSRATLTGSFLTYWVEIEFDEHD